MTFLIIFVISFVPLILKEVYIKKEIVKIKYYITISYALSTILEKFEQFCCSCCDKFTKFAQIIIKSSYDSRTHI